MEETAVNPAPPSAKRRIILIVLAAVLFLLALLGFLILGAPRRWQVDPLVSRQEAERMQNIIGKLTSSMITPEGKMAEIAEITLTPEEINTLLRTGLRAAQHRQKPDFYYDARWTSGALFLRTSTILGFLALNLEAEMVPCVLNGKVDLGIRSCSLGWLPLNSGIISAAIQKHLQQHADSDEFRALTEIVQSMTVQQDSVILVIRPQKINLLFSLLLNAAAESMIRR